ncbi:MAG: IstB domain protein ATP-binding protein [Bryobacterales bacterium]|nr:IstB domain protein ATP-binding protein [Bryobacterales bacterium]
MRSLILTSQLPVTRWHKQIGDPTVADGILDRLVHNAHRIEMRGDSIPKNRGNPNTLISCWGKVVPGGLISECAFNPTIWSRQIGKRYRLLAA